MPSMQRLSNYRTAWSTPSPDTGTVIYAATTIVQWDADTITLRDGGWDTVTTRRKMNQASNQFRLGFGVFQKDYKRFVTWNGRVIPFDGSSITLNRNEG